jgi:hypothetical protein
MWWDFSDGTTVAVHHTPVETEGLDGVAYEGLAEYALSDTTPAGDL